MKETTLDKFDKNITVVKWDGREEPFSKRKLKKVVSWACDGDIELTEQVIKNTQMNLKKKVKSRDLAQATITTAVAMISRLNTKMEFVSAKLELKRLYKESWGIKGTEYPLLPQVISKGIVYKIYDKDVINHYSEDDIYELGSYIKQERDYLFTYNALANFVGKYSKTYGKSKKLFELPQHTYMRVAMGLCYNMDDRVEMAKKTYDIISQHLFTFGSPHMIHAMAPSYQGASCVLSTFGNNTFDLMNKLYTAGIYTKYSGGLAFDISLVQAKGGLSKKGVAVSGIVPYIQNIEKVVSSMMQSENRRGMALITCHWWHYEIEDFLMLKDNSGSRENRAEKLKYAMATNNFYYNAVKNNDEIYLFDPLDAEALYWAKTDEEFEFEYQKLVGRNGIRKKKIRARELDKLYVKNYFQTGNVYETRISNINPNMTGRKVNSSNLCQEITEPSRPAEFVRESIYNIDGEETLHTVSKDEEIALCNLGSYNLKIFLPEWREKLDLDDLFYTCHRVLDNTITIGKYPRAAAKKTNLDYRYIGLGVSNFAYYLAKKGLKFTDKKSFEESFTLFQELHYRVTKANIRLAEEFGPARKYNETLWAKGVMLYDIGNKTIKEKFGRLLFRQDWYDELKEGIEKHGLRNVLAQAIAPTASCFFNPVIQTLKGNKKLYDIFDELDFDYKHIEESDVEGWYDLPKPVKIPTHKGPSQFSKVYYNGKKKTKIITMEDGTIFKATPEHKFKVLRDGKEEWVMVKDLKVGDKVVNINEYLKMTIIEIEDNEELLPTWDLSVDKYHEYIMANGCVTHNSGSSIGVIESIEPPLNYSYELEGSIQGTVLLPEFTKLNKYYELAYDIPQEVLIIHAAIRQIWLDQSQSVNMYLKEENWSYQYIMALRMLANRLGVKTSYYCNSPKQDPNEVCDACS